MSSPVGENCFGLRESLHYRANIIRAKKSIKYKNKHKRLPLRGKPRVVWGNEPSSRQSQSLVVFTVCLFLFIFFFLQSKHSEVNFSPFLPPSLFFSFKTRFAIASFVRGLIERCGTEQHLRHDAAHADGTAVSHGERCKCHTAVGLAHLRLSQWHVNIHSASEGSVSLLSLHLVGTAHLLSISVCPALGDHGGVC